MYDSSTNIQGNERGQYLRLRSGLPCHQVKEMAKVYRVPERTIRWLPGHERETGSMKANTCNCGRPPALSEEGPGLMRKVIEEHPDITLEEIKGKMKLSISVSAICRIVRYKLKFTYKKLYTRANGTVRKTRRNERRS
jgi:transposase